MKALGKLLCIAAVLNVASAAVHAETLEVAFWNQAPKLIQQFRDKNYANVGVLKFHVQKGADGKLSHTTGPLNYNAARRLETALILALANAEEDKGLMIIRDATKTASQIPKADHLGFAWQRDKLFAPIYSPSWGDQKLVFPDAFITGKLKMDDNLGKMTVQLEILDRKNPAQLQLLTEFVVDVRTDTLIETGHTFRSLLVDEIEKQAKQGKVVVEAAATTPAAKQLDPVNKVDPPVNPNPEKPNPVKPTPIVKEEPKERPIVSLPASGSVPAAGAAIVQQDGSTAPLVQPAGAATPIAVGLKEDVLKTAPVELQVFYDNTLVPLTFANGEYALPAPNPGQKVVFGMVRRDNSTDAKYGVVLMLNGMCTLGMERKPPTECQRWVFEKGDPAGFVAGFFKGDKTINAFDVVPPTADLRTEYKDNLGTISFTIFKEGTAAPKSLSIPLKVQVAEAIITKQLAQGANLQVPVPKDPTEAKVDVKQPKEVASNAEFPDDLPRSLASLRQRLEELASLDLRNAIVPGQAQAVEALRTTTFDNPGVQLSVTIRYFKGN